MLTIQQAKKNMEQATELMQQAQYAQAIELLTPAAAAFEAAQHYESYVQCLNKHSECLWQSGKNDEGIEKAEKALEICLERWGEECVETANVYNNLGTCYYYKGNYDQAISYHQQALTIRLTALGEQHPNTASSYGNLGVCYGNKGDYTQAISYHQQSLAIHLTTLGEQHPDTASSYNNLGTCYAHKGDHTQAISYFQQSLAIELIILGKQHPSTATSYHNLGTCYMYKGDYTQAISYHQQSLAIHLTILGEQHPDTASSYQCLGNCYWYKGDYTQAISYYQQALAIRLTTLGEQHPDTADTYNGLGVCYNDKGDYTQAISYYQQSLAIYLTTLGEQHPYTASSYNNLGICYVEKGDYTQAISYHQQALAIWLTTLGEQHPNTTYSHNNLGNCYYHKGDYTQAISYHQQALAIRLTTLGEQHPYVAGSYNNLGVCYNDKGDYTQAISYYQKSLAIRLTALGKQHPDTAHSYQNLAQIHHAQAQYPQALHHYQTALHSLALTVPETDHYPLPPLEGYNSAVELLKVLPAKAATFFALYQQDQATQDLAAALAHYTCADALIDQMRQSYKTEGSKLTLADKGKTKVYDAGLQAAFAYQKLLQSDGAVAPLSGFNATLGYSLPERPIDLAFHFSEKSKAVLLFAGMKDAEARLAAQLPPDLVQQEYDLRIELTYLERRISEEGYKKTEEQDSSALAEWQSQHFAYKQQYDALIEQLESDFPDYYRLKYDVGATTIAQTQALLPPQTALISYVVSEQNLYIIALTAEKNYWQETPLPADFEGLVEDFLLSFKQIGKNDFLTYGYDLYRHLLLPIVEAGLLDGVNRLILIPDGILSRLPFEALPTMECSPDTRYENIPYLLQQYSVQYHYSATLWANQQAVKQTKQAATTASGFVGFAPIYSDTAHNKSEQDIDLQLPDDFYEKTGIEKPLEQHRIAYSEIPEAVRSVIDGRNFVELPQSAEEVKNVAALFQQKGEPARVLLHQAANLSQFKALSGNYRYLLIAAHADYNGEKPDQTGIIFSPNEGDGNAIFYMGDAYNLRLQADLVVLSCCETGMGKSHNGEGTMALNRGFLYSGAKNVIYTLFKVYDRESSELTTELFRALLSDAEPITALRQAKLHLIQRGLMPNKWAGYVLVGE